jgi:hypothetical protein
LLPWNVDWNHLHMQQLQELMSWKSHTELLHVHFRIDTTRANSRTPQVNPMNKVSKTAKYACSIWSSGSYYVVETCNKTYYSQWW